MNSFRLRGFSALAIFAAERRRTKSVHPLRILFMKPEKKISGDKKTTASKKTSGEKPSPPPSTPKAAAKPAKAESSTTKKVAAKVAKVVEAAAKTTKKVAAKIKEVVEKTEPKVAKAADKAEAAAKPALKKAAEKIETTAAKVETAVKPVVKKAAEKIETAVTKARGSTKRKIEIPPILLEGDRPATPTVSGPGQRYALGPTPPVEHFAEMEELPEAYGTKQLMLTARDPHWLYAHWDFTHEQLKKYNALSADGHLLLRVYEGKLGGSTLTQVHVHPESKNWFVHVGKGGTQYTAELGYNNRAGKWVQLSASGATVTPPDSLSEDTSVRFATIPVDVPFEELVRIVKASLQENVPLAEAIQQLRAQGFRQLPEPGEFAQFKWTPEQERALASVISIDQVRRVWIGSLEITELVRRQLGQEISSLGAAQLQIPSSFSLASLSSPFGGMERKKGFWFNVNAELIIYGATEPDATVTIGGRKINLRKDGTFSYRFVLPDGNYDLPAQATSADGDDTRSAHLKFSRDTKYRGDVGAHPQDPKMKAPLVENVS